MILYIFLTLVVMAAIALSKSHDMMNLWTVLHAAFALILSLLLLRKLPVFYFDAQYMFIDHLSVFEMLIAAFIFLIAAIYARGYVEGMLRHQEMQAKTIKPFYLALNALMVSILLAFCSNNLALFWIFTELTTLFSAILIVTPNAKENIAVALSYVFMASTAMLFSFIGLILLFAVSKKTLGEGTLNWTTLTQHSAEFAPAMMSLAALFIFIGFATKSGVVPFHSWLPHAHAIAPSVISTILSAVMLNVGIYGLLRVYAILKPATGSNGVFSTVCIAFGLLSIALSALTMLAKKNLKRLIAFSSVENMGLLLLGIGLGSPIAIFWVLFHVLGHSLAKALMFMLSGVIRLEYHQIHLDGVDHLLKRQPLASFGLIVGSLAVIGMPLSPIFMSKIGLMSELGSRSLPLLFVAIVLFMLVGAAFTRFMLTLFTQRRGDQNTTQFQTPFSIHLAIMILIFALILCGVALPSPLKTLLTDAVSNLNI
ncbi:hydrogenase subunit, NADH dehydrogenase subunit N-like protein [Candidatus Moduliflexus flocculans]|uniref:Hydrogenase subunit, NADH dehydrogenase subunit N-like protein n=1 Tax=Candidatus Moduliflexus flocculans TaxID=1499966 RepID=A0A0S6W423_9BACT|nr:hydrogenase subunit, NADH dehydrogenase subunit N-like protein [Candidatus Moduliflexus flocculans]